LAETIYAGNDHHRNCVQLYTNTWSYWFRCDNGWEELLGKTRELVPEEDLVAVSPTAARESNRDAQPSSPSLEGRRTRSNLDPRRPRSAGVSASQDTAGSIGHFACNFEPRCSAKIIRTFDRFEDLRGHYANTHDWKDLEVAPNVFRQYPSRFLGAPGADLMSKSLKGRDNRSE
jgi:hypothetical protein